MVTDLLTGREIQTVQLMAGMGAAVFIGGRFLPPQYRRPVGVTLTVCYLIGFAAFTIYVLVR